MQFPSTNSARRAFSTTNEVPASGWNRPEPTIQYAPFKQQQQGKTSVNNSSVTNLDASTVGRRQSLAEQSPMQPQSHSRVGAWNTATMYTPRQQQMQQQQQGYAIAPPAADWPTSPRRYTPSEIGNAAAARRLTDPGGFGGITMPRKAPSEMAAPTYRTQQAELPARQRGGEPKAKEERPQAAQRGAQAQVQGQGIYGYHGVPSNYGMYGAQAYGAWSPYGPPHQGQKEQEPVQESRPVKKYSTARPPPVETPQQTPNVGRGGDFVAPKNPDYGMAPPQQPLPMENTVHVIQPPTKKLGDQDDVSDATVLVAWRRTQMLSVAQLLLGACIFALGLARLLLRSVWGFGIELVFGIYVVLTGTTGLVASRKKHGCLVLASYVMSTLATVLAIPPFVVGLLVTVPDSFPNAHAEYFTSEEEPYGVDLILSVVCLLEVIAAIAMSTVGCSLGGRIFNRSSGADQSPRPGMMTNQMMDNMENMYMSEKDKHALMKH